MDIGLTLLKLSSFFFIEMKFFSFQGLGPVCFSAQTMECERMEKLKRKKMVEYLYLLHMLGVPLPVS